MGDNYEDGRWGETPKDKKSNRNLLFGVGLIGLGFLAYAAFSNAYALLM